MKHTGDLDVFTAYDAAYAANVTHVSGELLVLHPCSLPALEYVHNSVHVGRNATCIAPKLHTIGRDLAVFGNVSFPSLVTVHRWATVERHAVFPALTTINGWLTGEGGADFPALTTIGGSRFGKHNTPKLASLRGEPYPYPLSFFGKLLKFWMTRCYNTNV